MSDDERMDVPKVLDLLEVAIPLQMRSTLQLTWLAGSAVGVEFQSIAVKFEEFSQAELHDTRRLMEKMTALGGTPPTGVAPLEAIPSSVDGVKRLIELEQESLDALHAIIPATGQEARSEALEHLLEHVIMRKQHQVDFLLRVTRTA
ncbi:MAG TPA: ferritin-like domain-containing protein [Actinomycetota bacterium]|nr:ferritin-like domain-containing protein [Actinomycetota bacterium]